MSWSQYVVLVSAVTLKWGNGIKVLTHDSAGCIHQRSYDVIHSLVVGQVRHQLLDRHFDDLPAESYLQYREYNLLTWSPGSCSIKKYKYVLFFRATLAGSGRHFRRFREAGLSDESFCGHAHEWLVFRREIEKHWVYAASEDIWVSCLLKYYFSFVYKCMPKLNFCGECKLANAHFLRFLQLTACIFGTTSVEVRAKKICAFWREVKTRSKRIYSIKADCRNVKYVNRIIWLGV